MHVIAAKAVCFKEALEPGFKDYQAQVIRNAKAMAEVFIGRGYDVVSGGTDNHLMLISLVRQGLTGKEADAALGRVGITVNKNAVPNDPQSPFVTSGIRIGTPAAVFPGRLRDRQPDGEGRSSRQCQSAPDPVGRCQDAARLHLCL